MQKVFHRAINNSMVRITVIVFMVALIAGATFAEWQGLRTSRLLGYDYAFFYYAFQVVLQHQPSSQFYQMALEQRYVHTLMFPFIAHNQYVYPPQFAVLLSYFGRLPFRASLALWMAMSTAMYGLGIYWTVQTLWPGIRRSMLLIILLLSLIMQPFQMDVLVGNVNSILFALVALSLYLHFHKKRSIFAGIPLGLAIVFKVTPVIVPVYFLLRKQWKLPLSAAITALVMSIPTAMLFGYQSIVHYAQTFSSLGQTSMEHGPAPYNQSFLGVIGLLSEHRWLQWPTHVQHNAFLAYVVFSALLLLFVARKTPLQRTTDVAVASLTPLLFSPLVEEMHMTYAIPALLAMVRLTQESMADGSRCRTFVFLGTAMISPVGMTLPFTFAMNSVVYRYPNLFWVQTQMFWILLLLYGVTAWHAIRTRYDVAKP